MRSKITIAIDGHSSTGKSTVARQIAKHLGYVYVDSGAMYRAVTLYALNEGFIGDGFFEIGNLLEKLDDIKISFVFNEALGLAETYLNNVNVEQEIRTLRVSSFVSQVAAISEVRSKMVEQQQAMGKAKGVVMDGRDIGTVVFPEAELKIFMTASPEVRSKRRYEELKSRGESIEFEEVMKNVRERDYIDSHREDSPLVKANDAIELDNSLMTLEEQYQKILLLVEKTVSSKE